MPLRPLLFALPLCACAGLNPVTLIELAALDPLTADPEDFAIMVSLPEGVRLDPTQAALMLEAEGPDGAVGGRFALEQREGEAWRIAPDALDPLRQTQAEIATMKATFGDAARGSLSLFAAPCRTIEAPDMQSPLSAQIQIEEAGPFLPLLPPTPIEAYATAQEISTLPLCSP